MGTDKAIIAANWKMNLGRDEALTLAGQCEQLADSEPNAEIRLFPGFLALREIQHVAQDGPLRVGAQNCHCEESGAFTGEVSPAQLVDAGVKHVLIGHSERRHTFGESDELIARKLCLATQLGLHVTLCVGETLEERDGGKESEVISLQLSGLKGVSGLIDIAY